MKNHGDSLLIDLRANLHWKRRMLSIYMVGITVAPNGIEQKSSEWN